MAAREGRMKAWGAGRRRRTPIVKQSRFRVYERVVFDYVYDVDARTKSEAARKVDTIGDGEAREHNELTRRVRFVEKLPT